MTDDFFEIDFDDIKFSRSWRSLNEEEQQEVNSDEENSAFGHLGFVDFVVFVSSQNSSKAAFVLHLI